MRIAQVVLVMLCSLVTVNTASAQGIGKFLKKVIRAAENPSAVLTGCANVQEYELGTAVQGRFATSDCHVDAGMFRHPVVSYGFLAERQRDIAVVVEAPGLDVSLRLLNDDGVVLAETYGGDFGTLTKQVPAGSYTVVLESKKDGYLGGGERLYGRFTMRSSTDDVGFAGCPDVAPIRMGARIQGDWSVADCEMAQGVMHRYADYYLLDVSEQRDVLVTLSSSGINSQWSLFERDGAPVMDGYAVVESEHPFPGQQSMPRQLAPGRYILEVKVSDMTPRETGRYILTVR